MLSAVIEPAMMLPTYCHIRLRLSPVAPLCRRMYAISWAVSMKLRGTSTTGTRAVANASTAYCQQLCASNAMRSAGPNPLSCRAAAARSTVVSKSANVIVTSPSMIATLSGVRRAERRGMSPMLWLRALVVRSSGPAFTWVLPVACGSRYAPSAVSGTVVSRRVDRTLHVAAAGLDTRCHDTWRPNGPRRAQGQSASSRSRGARRRLGGQTG
jgi:hypothetical protein